MKINDGAQFEMQNIFGLGRENSAFAQYFTGRSYLNPLTVPGDCAVFLANVTFLSRAAAIIGIYTERVEEAGSCLYARPAAAGIRRRADLL